jgi:hypothetical protein
MLITLSACADQATQPVETAPPDRAVPALSNDGGKQALNQLSSVRWNRTAIALFRSRAGNAGRVHAYLALAEYQAARATGDGRGRQHWHHTRQPSLAGAVSGAAVVVLKQFYPLDATIIDAELATQRAMYGGVGQGAFDSGENLGREIGAAVLVQAASDNSGLTPLPTQPVGPGFWVSSGAPIVKGGFGTRPFFLRSQDEINAPAPPAFGSAAFLAALAEVRAFSDSRTPAQVAITLKWVPFSGVLFNEIAANLIEKHHRGELAATRILALGNMAAFDAIIGCFETKYVYWYIRPTQADPLITLATGLPNHPSYPSAHSCETGAWQTVLTEAFPSERRMLSETAEEASLSRVLGGLHYRFDGEAGLALGHRAGRLALRRGIR